LVLALDHVGRSIIALRTLSQDALLSAVGVKRPVSLAAALGLALMAVVWVALMLLAEWREVLTALHELAPAALAAALACSLVCYSVRFFRWNIFTRRFGYSIPAAHNFGIFLSGLGFSWTPGKAGELLRGVFLSRYGVSLPRTFLLFYWDRLSDLAGMVVLALVAVMATASGSFWIVFLAAAIAASLWLARPGGKTFTQSAKYLQTRVPAAARRVLQGLSALSQADARIALPTAIFAVGAAVAAYSIQAVGLLAIAASVGIELDFGFAVLVMSISTLAGAAILLPAGAGVVEVSSVGLLMLHGVEAADAVALSLAHRATTFWFATVLGGVVFSGLLRRHG
jgi:glycosyltransferase 2 family protein